MEKHPDDKKPVVEYTVKITLPNGEIIKKTISTVARRIERGTNDELIGGAKTNETTK